MGRREVSLKVLTTLVIAIFSSAASAQQACTSYSRAEVDQAISDIFEKVEKGEWAVRNSWELRLTLNDALSRVHGSVKQLIGQMPDEKFYSCFPRLKNISVAIERGREREASRQKQIEEEETRVAAKSRAENDAPSHVLVRSYFEYGVIKECHGERKGYLQVNISDQEMEQAKTAVINIEKKLLESEPSLNKDELWRTATGENRGWQTDRDKTDMIFRMYDERGKLDVQNKRRQCQLSLQYLLGSYKKLVPGSAVIPKDF